MRDNSFHEHVCFKLIQVCGVNDDARQAKHAGMIIKMNIRFDALSLSGFFGGESTYHQGTVSRFFAPAYRIQTLYDGTTNGECAWGC